MKINYIGNDIKPTDAIKAYVEKRVEKLEKYFEQEIEIDVNFRVQGDVQGVHMTVIAGKNRYRAITEDTELYEAVDKTVDVLVGQITKSKGIKEARRREKVQEVQENFDEEEFAPENEIIKFVNFDAKPLDPEDAKMILKDSTDVFLTFINARTEKTNVIFKLKDGKNFGLIEPEF